MEKNSSVVLTADEIVEIAHGLLPLRLSQTWGFSLEELRAIIDAGTYTITSWSPGDPGNDSSNISKQ